MGFDPTVPYPPGVTIDGHRLAAGDRVFVRAVLVDPRTPAVVVRHLPGRQTTAWATGDKTSLWVVRLGDGRAAVIDPSLACVGPLDRQLNLMHLAWMKRTPRTRGGLPAVDDAAPSGPASEGSG
jgi:hypothetical protein